MILESGYYHKYNDEYTVYLELFPVKLYNYDIKAILDGAFEEIKYWTLTVKWKPLSRDSHTIIDFIKGQPIYIMDYFGDEHVLTKEKLVKGIAKAYEIYGKSLVNKKGTELNSWAFPESLCTEIIQLSLYNEYKFVV